MKSLAIFLPFVAATVFANGQESHNPPTPPAPPSAESQANARSNAEASSSSNSDSTSDSSASSNSGGNAQNQSTVYQGVRSAPGVYTAATNTTAKCQGEWHVGGSVPGGGLSFGKSRTIRDCMLDELATAELARGNLSASILLRCRISFYIEALGADCPALLNTQTQDKPYATKEYVDRAFKSSMEK